MVINHHPKHFFSALVGCLLALASQAQFSITKQDWFRPFSMQKYAESTSADAASFINGEGLTWNFQTSPGSEIQTIDIQKQGWYLNMELPDSLLAIQWGNREVWLYSARNNGIFLQGMVMSGNIWKSLTGSPRIPFPLDYGSTHVQESKFSYVKDTSFLFVVDSVRRTRTIQQTITTPAYGNYLISGVPTACMLVREDLVVSDTISYHNSFTGWFNSLTQPEKDTLVNFYWMSNMGGFFPAVGFLKNGQYTLWTSTSNPAPSAIAFHDKNEINPFPNPFTDRIQLKSEGPDDIIRIIDLQGKIIKQYQQLPAGMISLLLEELMPDSYYLCSGIQTKRIQPIIKLP